METQDKGHLKCTVVSNKDGIIISIDTFHGDANLSADTFQDAWNYLDTMCKLLRAAEGFVPTQEEE